ncbi:MAG TPA: hypothetical protein DDY98_06220 [Ruminococcaceae bacterium]|nr:hypothetical protein [Oscillospiraceae bacterium]
MGIIEIVLIAVSLAMDAFAVSICKGLNMTKFSMKNALIIGGFFGVFQALMPTVGWLLGSGFQKYITSFDHWIAFGLLALIGANMVREALGKDEDDNENADKLKIKELFALAIATSIDALAVGITFALQDNVNIGWTVLLIGIITFVISVGGVFIGNRFGAKYKSKAELAGGIILILIGLKILLEDLGVLNIHLF